MGADPWWMPNAAILACVVFHCLSLSRPCSGRWLVNRLAVGAIAVGRFSTLAPGHSSRPPSGPSKPRGIGFVRRATMTTGTSASVRAQPPPTLSLLLYARLLMLVA